MVSDVKIFPIMLLRQLNFGALSVQQLSYVYYKGKTPLFFINSFYCCLVKEVRALKVAQQFAVRGLVAYKLVAYKKLKCIGVLVNIYIAIVCFPGCDVKKFKSNPNFLIKSFFYIIKTSRQKSRSLNIKRAFKVK